jgi:hypothetical protein
MDIEVRIFSALETILFILIILIALIYSIPIICIRRFHQPNNILTLNICLAVILCCLSWLPTTVVFILNTSNEVIKDIAIPFYIAEMLLTIQVPFSFVVASMHRYYFVIYHRNMFFKRKRWIILCIGSQWILGFILTIPNLICILDTVKVFFSVLTELYRSSFNISLVLWTICMV